MELTGYALFLETQYKMYLADNATGVSKERLKAAVAKGVIKDTDYKSITGEDYA